MKIIKFILFITFISIGILFSGDSAYPLEQGNRSKGVFQPLIYGFNNNIEISTHPILFAVKPNFRLKKLFVEKKGFAFASRFSFDYPTQLLRLIQHRGYFAFISEDSDIGEIPQMVVLQAELLATKRLPNYSLSGKLGMSICPSCEIDTRHLMDYDLIYPRMAIYHRGTGANVGLDFDYIVSEKISLKADADLLLLPQESLFFEHKFLLHYNLSKKYTLSAGYKASHGQYAFNKPEESLWNVFPLIDLSWQWSK